MLKPLPILKGPGEFENIPIKECDEPLVSLTSAPQNRIKTYPQYFHHGYKMASQTIYLRQGVLKLLEKAVKLLPNGYCFLVYDGWRPVALQAELFNEYRSTVESNNPNLSEASVIKQTKMYVSYPSTSPSAPSPHLTGGAVDLTICNSNGQAVRMGTEFDFFGPEAETRFYEQKVESYKILSVEEQECLENRRLLFYTLTDVGFTNYREEWWHYDLGNQFWGSVKNKEAFYGAASVA
ncbi:MAG: D-alanyl-D-alanine dipeptidase [Gammaproteobacteria bacterium]|nr:D-alanyl-D-alanine dipeptidase [Gammaproteobacteria bacterium]